MAIFEHRLVPAGADPGTDPTSRFLQIITGYWATQILRTAAELRLADRLAAAGDGAGTDEGRTAAELAEAMGTHAANTERFLRGCTAIGLLTCEDGVHYRTTELLDLTRSNRVDGLRDLALWGGMDSHWRPWNHLADAVRQGTDQSETALGHPIFQLFDADPAEGERFTRAMTTMTWTLGEKIAACIDPGDARVVVDVGGAAGELSRALLRDHDELVAYILDLPHVAAEIEREAGRDGMANRVLGVAGDFFEEVPEGDLCLVKHILHDWDDEACVRILANCRRALRPGGRVMVMELVLDPAGGAPVAPLFDLNMMVLSPGRERTEAQYADLFARAGLAYEGLTGTGTAISILSARPE